MNQALVGLLLLHGPYYMSELLLQAFVLSASILGPVVVYYEVPFWEQSDVRFLHYIDFRTPHIIIK